MRRCCVPGPVHFAYLRRLRDGSKYLHLRVGEAVLREVDSLLEVMHWFVAEQTQGQAADSRKQILPACHVTALGQRGGGVLPCYTPHPTPRISEMPGPRVRILWESQEVPDKLRTLAVFCIEP